MSRNMRRARRAAGARRVGGRTRAVWLRSIGCLVAGLIGLLVGPIHAQETSATDGGTVSGRVFDAQSGTPLENATVILAFPDPGDGTEPRQDVSTTGPAGDYEFDAVPAGTYSLQFIKSGYRASTMSDFVVEAGRDNVANFPMPPQQTTATGEVMELGEFVVEAAVAGEMMSNLEMRLESDQLVNLLSAEDLSKYAASDVADALKRVAGVNVVEGQFAIIRGLEDRYSSTLYNGAPIPSPDPESQSVQLDLFPSDVVSNLEIGKTFAANSPSNSAGGSIDIVTHDYPEELTFKLQGGSGFNERALDEFRRYDELSAVGVPIQGDDTIESDYGALVGGRHEIWDRELRFKLVFANETDFETRNGIQQRLEPKRGAPPRVRPDGSLFFARTGGLALGELNRPGARWDQQESTREDQTTYYAGLGYDLDREGRHRIDGSWFRTEKRDETVQFRENGFVPGVDYANILALEAEGSYPIPQAFTNDVADTWLFDWHEDLSVATGKHSFYAPVYESRTIARDRDLSVYQLNGVHELEDLVEGLEIDWIASYAETNQDEVAFLTRYSFQPNDPTARPPSIPAHPRDFPGGGFYATRSDMIFGENEIEENQYFGRIDLEYVFEPASFLETTLTAGYWFEQANRSVDSRFQTNATADSEAEGVLGSGSQFSVTGATAIEMGRRVFQGASLDTLDDRRPFTSRGKREISATHFGAKLTFFEQLDAIGRIRIENLRIETVNDPFTGFCANQPVNPDGTCPQPGIVETIFPGRYLFFDRQDNPAFPQDEIPAPPGTAFNDQVIGFRVQPDPVTGFVDCRDRACLERSLRGEINDTLFLPEASLAYRPLEGLSVRFAYSQTVARPSFRELGYYASLELGGDEITVGNPQLKTSEVESFDGRVEWVYGDFGDLVAGSVFYKTIEDPIEQIVIRDAQNRDCTGLCQFRTYTNTRAEATLLGTELEARKTFDFVPWKPVKGFFEALSIGGNFTYIDAEVERNPFLISQFTGFFGVTDADRAAGLERFSRYKKKRRLFGQPEWIANGDVTFDYEPTGTRFAVTVFAISEILDAVGSADLSGNNGIVGVALDRYIDEFYQLDLIASQDFAIPRVPGGFTAKVSVKNVTDTTRKVIYDQAQTNDDVRERSFRIGRDYSFSIGYTLTY